MKAFWILVSLTLTGIPGLRLDTAVLKADHKAELTKPLLAVEHDMDEAMKAGDVKALTNLCADDFVVTDEGGELHTRADFFTDLAKISIVSYSVTGAAVSTYGDTAIVTGKWKGKVRTGGTESDVAFSFTDTFVKRDGKWWAIASHMSGKSGD